MTVLELPIKESRSTSLSLLPLNGIYRFLVREYTPLRLRDLFMSAYSIMLFFTVTDCFHCKLQQSLQLFFLFLLSFDLPLASPYIPFCAKVAVLGRGSSATVCLGVIRDNGGRPLDYVAVKSAPLPFASAMLMREKLIMDALHGCPELLQCIGDELVLDATNRNTPPIYNMYLEYACRGSLHKLIQSSRGLPEHAVRRYTKSILRGLAHIHKRGYVHSDLKPENILVWTDSDVKIADFGLSKKAGKSQKGFGCTPAYASPETLTHGDYEAPLDIWSLGCTVVEMVTGDLALKCTKELKLSEEGRDFLCKCFARDPKERWTADKLLLHPFVSSSGAQHSDNHNHHSSSLPLESKCQDQSNRCDEAIAKGPRFGCSKWQKGCNEAIAKGPRFGNLIV